MGLNGSSTQGERTQRALNIAAKWRGLFAGWQLGTRVKGDPESDAVRDHREQSILLRIESSALVQVLLAKGIIGHDEWLAALEVEAKELCAMLERRFPGVVAFEDGLRIDARVATFMEGWRP